MSTLLLLYQTIGALQLKLKASNVRVSYDWMYGQNEARGKSILAPQDMYIDLDIERVRYNL